MKNINFYKYLLSEKKEKWSGKVKLKWHAPDNLFKDGTAQEISNIVSKNVNLKTAMSRLNFYLNRGGSNISIQQKQKIQKAKDLLRNK